MTPTLDDSLWSKDVSKLYWLSAERPQRSFWVIWNHGASKRVVGKLTRPLRRDDDVEAWQPC